MSEAQSPLIWALANVRLPSPDGWKPFSPYPYQAALLADRAPRRIALKARQVGITTAAAIEAAHELLFVPRSMILVVSKTEADAAEFVRKVASVFEGLDQPPRMVRESLGELLLENGSRIVSQAATAKAGRGFTATSVFLDEFAFAEYDSRIYRGVSPTVARGGRLTVISTPNGTNNLFSRLWSGQEGGEWSRHRVHWRDCPAFDDAWYERERPKYTASDWASEFECDFVASGGAAFDPADVDAMRDGWAGLQPPQPGRTYISAWDIGRRRDATVGITVDVAELPHQVIAYTRLQRAPYAQIGAAIDARAAEYGGATWVESNSIGDPVLEALTCRALPFVTTAKSKADALTRLVRLVEQGHLKAGVPQLLSELKTYQYEDSGIVQDSVMALAIALHAVGEAGGFYDLNAWDGCAGFIPMAGAVAHSYTVIGLDTDADFSAVNIAIVGQHWDRLGGDLVLRMSRRWDGSPDVEKVEQAILTLAKEYRPVAFAFPAGLGLEPFARRVQEMIGCFSYPLSETDIQDYAMQARGLIRERRLLHGGDVVMRQSMAAARLRPGAAPALVAGGDIGLSRALVMAVGEAARLNLEVFSRW